MSLKHCVCALALMLAAAGTALAAEKPAPTPEQLDASARAYFSDTELVTQDGRKVKFYTDVLRGKVVVINFIFTHCDDACPLVTAKLAQVKDEIKDLWGKPIHFVSISTDPENDTPESLKAFARKNKAESPNWTFLTGSKESVQVVLKKLSAYTQEREIHSTELIAGNVPIKKWQRIRPDAPVNAVALSLRQLAGSEKAALGVSPGPVGR